MTLGIILLADGDTIVIVSDKRVTGGTYQMSAHGDVVEKIHKITDKSGLTISGDPGSAITVIDLFLKEVEVELTRNKSKELPITQLAEIFRVTAVNNFTKWYKDMSMKEWVDNVKANVIPYFRVLLAGYDLDKKGKLTKPKIIEVSSLQRFAPVSVTTKFASIGVTTIAQYLLYRFYTENKEENKVAGLAAFCIQETNSQDDSVGDQFQVASFSRSKPFQFYSDSQLEEIKNRCAELKTELQTALFLPPKIKEQ